MANFYSNSIIFIAASSFLILSMGDESTLGTMIDTKQMGVEKEMLSHFHFYWHDKISGNNPSTITIISPLKTSKTAFGLVRIFDSPLTIAQDLGSTMVGRGEGFYAMTSQEKVSLLMTMNIVFTEGKYNGSTITLLGCNPAFNKAREVPVVGGSGLFRFARGYAQLETRRINLRTQDVTVEYNVYVLHYG